MEEAQTIDSACGLPIHVRRLGDPASSRAGALFFHGLGEHSGRHLPLLERLAGEGLYIRTFDLPGHGRSGGHRGHFESIESLTALFQEQLTGLKSDLPSSTPVGWMGHSMGGFLALYFLTQFPSEAQFAWISSSLIDPEANASWLKRFLARNLAKVAPRLSISNGIDANQCVTPEIAQARAEDPLLYRRLTIGLGAILIELSRKLHEDIEQTSSQLQLLMTHGELDTVCPPSLSRALFDRMPTATKHYHLIPGGLHEPFQGADRQEHIDLVVDWFTEELLSTVA